MSRTYPSTVIQVSVSRVFLRAYVYGILHCSQKHKSINSVKYNIIQKGKIKIMNKKRVMRKSKNKTNSNITLGENK